MHYDCLNSVHGGTGDQGERLETSIIHVEIFHVTKAVLLDIPNVTTAICYLPVLKVL